MNWKLCKFEHFDFIAYNSTVVLPDLLQFVKNQHSALKSFHVPAAEWICKLCGKPAYCTFYQKGYSLCTPLLYTVQKCCVEINGFTEKTVAFTHENSSEIWTFMTVVEQKSSHGVPQLSRALGHSILKQVWVIAAPVPDVGCSFDKVSLFSFWT